MINEQEILQALNVIIDPDLGKDIVSLGFVKNIQIEGSNVSLTIELTTPACPVKQKFHDQAKELVLALPGVSEVQVTMSAQARKAAVNLSEDSCLKHVKSIIAVSSCKGGVGKSTVAALLAQELAGRGFKVGLLDLDLFGPSVPTLFGLRNAGFRSTAEKKFLPVHKGNLKLMSFGFVVGDSPVVVRGPMATGYVQQLLHNVDWGELDYLFLDLPPGTGDIQLTITQSVELDGAVIVSTAQALSLVDVSKGMIMFEKVNVPMLGIIENMAYFLCDSCDKRHYPFGKQASQELAERFGIPCLGELPMGSYSLQEEPPRGYSEVQQLTDNMIRALGKNAIKDDFKPKIDYDQSEMRLSWPSGQDTVIAHLDLRDSCRCAHCVSETTGEKLLKREQIRKDIEPLEVSTLGNYALAIKWNDGHSSGIYPYKVLKERNRHEV